LYNKSHPHKLRLQQLTEHAAKVSVSSGGLEMDQPSGSTKKGVFWAESIAHTKFLLLLEVSGE
jgi:hypothetical protein